MTRLISTFERLRIVKSKGMQEAQKFFMTGVSLVTSYGPHGKNVMAAEWTMQISYKPMLISVFIHDGSSTLDNIKNTKEFGVNMASDEQATLVSIAGGYSRKEIDKLALDDSFQVPDSRSSLPMISSCVINAKCKLVSIKKIGDHNMVIGKVISIKYDETKKPLAYHRNRYFKIGHMIEPARQKVTVSKQAFDLFSLQTKSKFILKCVGVLVRSKNKILVYNNNKEGFFNTIPHISPKKGRDHKKELENHLRMIKLPIILKKNPRIKRLIIRHKDENQRINFIIFDGKLKNNSGPLAWKITNDDPLLKFLIK